MHRLLLFFFLFILPATDILSACPDKTDSLLNVMLSDSFYTDKEVALDLLDKAWQNAVCRKSRDHQLKVILHYAWLADNLSDLNLMKGYLQKADSLVAVRDERKIKNSTLSDYYWTQGNYLTSLGDLWSAIDTYNKILKAGLNTTSENLYDIYTNLAFTYTKAGNGALAIQSYEKAKAFIPGTPEEEQPNLQVHIRQSLGNAYISYYLLTKDQALLENAVASLHQSLKQLPELEKANPVRAVRPRAISHINLARAYRHMQKADSVLYYLNQVDAVARPMDRLRFFSVRTRADLYSDLKQYDSAMIYYNQALEIARVKYDEHDIFTYQLDSKVIRLLAESGRFQQAFSRITAGLEKLEKQKRTLSATAYANKAIPLYAARANAWYKAYVANAAENADADQVLQYFNEALGYIKEVRKGFPNQEYKEFLSGDAKELIGNAIHISYLQYLQTADPRYITLAHTYSEESKSLTILENLLENEAIKYANIPDSMLARGIALRRNISETEKLIYSRKATYADLQEHTAALNNHIAVLEQDFPEYYQLKYQPSLPDLETIRENLEKEQVLLHYFLQDSALYLITISPEEVKFKKTAPFNIRHLEEVINTVSSNPALANHKPGSDLLLQQLYRELMIPEEGKDLLIIPDGKLHLLPFEALRTPAGRYLVLEKSINYQLSSSLWNYSRTFRPRRNQALSYAGFAPDYSGAETVEIRGDNQGAGTESVRLGKLRYNYQEVENMYRIFSGTAYTGISATRTRFLESAGNSSILHLSMHGIYNDRSPLQSALYFTPPEEGAEPGWEVAAYELYKMRLNADLGILSACESGYGDYRTGEGLTSLQRAFFYAGCRSIVASLWQANDEATYKIISYFGENLEKGQDKAEALRQAKITFLETAEGIYKYPYYWSHLTLTGNTAPLFNSSWNLWLQVLLVLVVSFIIMTAIYFLVRNKDIKK